MSALCFEACLRELTLCGPYKKERPMLLQYSLYLMPMLANTTPAFKFSPFDSAETLRSYLPPD